MYPVGFPGRAEVGAYILAGGASRRMGRDKARLELGGESVVRMLARRFEPHVCNVALVAKPWQRFADLGLAIVHDASREHALVHGMRAALAGAGPPWRLLLACDMPGVGPELLGILWGAARAASAPGACLCPEDRTDADPLPSLWRADVAARVRESWGLTARDWLRHAGLAVVRVPAAAVPANVNTPSEWRSYRDGGAGRTIP